MIGADILDKTGQNAFSFGRLRIQPIATPGRGNHNFEGRSYLLSWREEGRPRYSWAQARDFCSSAFPSPSATPVPRSRPRTTPLSR